MVCSINQLETKQSTYIYHITLKSTKKERKENKAIVMQLSSNCQAIVKQLSNICQLLGLTKLKNHTTN